MAVLPKPSRPSRLQVVERRRTGAGRRRIPRRRAARGPSRTTPRIVNVRPPRRTESPTASPISTRNSGGTSTPQSASIDGARRAARLQLDARRRAEIPRTRRGARRAGRGRRPHPLRASTAIVRVSITSTRDRTPAPASSRLSVLEVLRRSTAAATAPRCRRRRSRGLRASSVSRTFCTTLRSTTMAATPMATQMKKNTSRSQEARVSRQAMRRTKAIGCMLAAPGRCDSTTRPSLQGDHFVGQRGQLGVVRHEHQRASLRAAHGHQQFDDLPSGRAIEIARGLVGEQDGRIVRRARARSPRAAARRPTAATDSDGRDRPGPTSCSSRSARARASRAPAISIGTRMFSKAVSDGSRWKNWKTMPIFSPRSRASAFLALRGDVDAIDDDGAGRRRVETGDQTRAAWTCRCPTAR